MKSLRTSMYLKLTIFFLMSVVGVAGIYSARALYADGSFVLYEVLSRRDFFIFDMPRTYAQYVMQWPVVVAFKMGLNDLNIFLRIFSFGLIVIPLLIWMAALFLQRRSEIFWLFVLGFSVSYLRTNFFAVGEFNITNSLVALSLAIILLRRLTIVLVFTLLMISVILMRSYESCLFFGVFLALTVVVRLVANKDDHWMSRLVLLCCAACFAFGSAIAAQSVFFNRSYDVNSTINLYAFKEYHLAFLLTSSLIAISLCLKINQTKKRYLLVIGIFVSMLYAIYVLRWDQTGISYGYFSYAYRSQGAFLLVGLLFFTWLLSVPRINNFLQINVTYLSMVVCCVFLIESGLLLKNSIGFYDWLKRFEAVAISIEGFKPIDKTSINDGESAVSGFNWPWTNSTLSILLRGDAKGVVTNATNFANSEPIALDKIDVNTLGAFSKRNRIYP